MTRPATVIAVLVVVLLHAVLLVGGTAASGIALATFLLTHPDLGPTTSVIVPSVLGALLTLVLAAGDVVLVLRVWNAAPRARVVLTVWLVLSGLITLGGVVTSLVQVAAPSVPFVSLWVVEVGLCIGAVVLLRSPETTGWLRGRSVRPARPGL